MSEPPPALTDLEGEATPPITHEDLVRFLESRNVNGTCERCGTNSWAMSTSENAITLGVPFAGNTSRTKLLDNAPAIPVCATVCHNCGNVRLFASFAILNWMEIEAVDASE